MIAEFAYPSQNLRLYPFKHARQVPWAN
jgi:hypothetical protein